MPNLKMDWDFNNLFVDEVKIHRVIERMNGCIYGLTKQEKSIFNYHFLIHIHSCFTITKLLDKLYFLDGLEGTITKSMQHESLEHL